MKGRLLFSLARQRGTACKVRQGRYSPDRNGRITAFFVSLFRMKLVSQAVFGLVLCLAGWQWASAETISTASLKKNYATTELDQMLAPVALYPDGLLLEVLAASSYPGEVNEAARWLCSHHDRVGEAAIKAAKGKNWKSSVKTLLAFPGVLAGMSARMEWTVKAGKAFHDQQKDVLDRIQYLRRKARATDNLKSDERITVIMTGSDIVIEPASSETVYIPCYYPVAVYGSWLPPLYVPNWRLTQCGGTGYPVRCNEWGEAVRFRSSRFHGRIDWPTRRVKWQAARGY